MDDPAVAEAEKKNTTKQDKFNAEVEQILLDTTQDKQDRKRKFFEDIKKIMEDEDNAEEALAKVDQKTDEFNLDENGKLPGTSPSISDISDQMEKFKGKVEALFGPKHRSTKRSVLDITQVILGLGEFELLDDGQIIPKDPAIALWIIPHNDIVLAEQKLGDNDNISDFRQMILEAIVTMAEGDWISHGGIPKGNGLLIHVANPPEKKNPTAVDKIRSRFRRAYYKTAKDTVSQEQEELFKTLKKSSRLKIGHKNWQEAGEYLIARGNTKDCLVKKRGHWRNERKLRQVCIYHLVTPDRTFILHFNNALEHIHRRISVFLNTAFAAKSFKIETEMRAMEKLQGMLTPEQYAAYFISGVFEETGKSGVTYFVRRLKPTVAFREKKDAHFSDFVFLAGLCLHPLAYYMDSFVGCQCPTDDVIAHLLWIRGDERRFWGKANHHPIEQVEVGLP